VTPTIAIVGVGNLLLSDDGAGIHAVRRLRSDARVGSMARLIDGGTIGTDLLAEVCGCEKLLIVDAVDAGLPPGATVRMDFGGPDPQRVDARNTHQFGIPGLLDDLRLLGQAPRQVVLVGVQPAAMGLGTELSPEVASALPGSSTCPATVSAAVSLAWPVPRVTINRVEPGLPAVLISIWLADQMPFD